MNDDVVFEHRGADRAAADRTHVEDVYRRAYAERIARGEPFGAPDAFMLRFDSYVTNPSFSMVTAMRDGEWIGQSWGWPLDADSRWWNGLAGEPEPGFTAEDGRRTFALSEIMVDRGYTGRGTARGLHDRLLGDRPESRATLLVNPANERARSTYLRWGWSPVAHLRPGWPDAPMLDVLVRPLSRPSG